ncbi:MAG: MFS transporter [Collimonas pratensis]|uniref:MFS transporter n=1 Tax=Collimonas pratensis TaxID=279113 RepID=UPI003C70CF19
MSYDSAAATAASPSASKIAKPLPSSERIALDDVPVNRFHIKIAGLTFGAHLTEGYAIGTIGYALTSLSQQIQLSPSEMGMIGGSTLVGIFFGSLLFGRLSDIVGRKKIFLYSFIIITLAAFGQFFAETALQLTLMRFLIGVGMGGDFSVGHTILAEFSPRKHRGTLLGSFSVIWTVGYVIANVIGLSYGDSAPDAWRWLLASAGIPALIILLLRIGTPESPRWLLSKGRKAEAEAVVLKHFGPNVKLEGKIETHAHSGYSRLFQPDLIRRTLFNCLFFTCLVIPYFAIYTFLPLILKIMGLNEGFGTDFMLNTMLVVGAVLGIWLTIKLPRRVFLIASFAVTAAALALLALLPQSATVAMILLFSAFTLTLSAVSNLVGVFPAECFPTEVRACGVGLAVAASRLGSAAGTYFLPISMATLGFSPTIFILSAILIAGMLVSIAWAPETKQLTLNQACGN